jgi:hypothetical protein
MITHALLRTCGIASASSRRPAYDKPSLRASDVEFLTWLAEQYAARADQLELLLGRSERTVQRTTARLRAAGLIQTQRLLVGEPAWVMPTSAGLRLSGHGFSLWRPHLALLAHVAGVNEVRLHVQARSPGAQWISERLLAREREGSEHLCDGLVLEGIRRIAIEVELTVKSRKRVTSILDELCGRHDAVLYYCAPAPQRQLTKLAATGRWPKLGVRELWRRTTSS